MAWFAVYQVDDGRLISGTSDQTKIAALTILNARGYAVKQFPDGAQLGVWNQSTLQYDAAQAQAVLIDPGEFFELLNPNELQKWSASNNPTAHQFFLVLQGITRPINLLGRRVQRVLNGMTAAGYWDDQAGVAGAPTVRPAAILAFRPTQDI